MTPTVVCVLRSGGEYTPDHVRALHASVAKHWGKDPLRFVALTDMPIQTPGIEERSLWHRDWRGWWCKMEVFSAAQDDLGDILYFDLDTMIVGGLREIAAVGCLTMLSDFYFPERAQSGVMYLPEACRSEACGAWLQDPIAVMRMSRGDGEFLDTLWRTKAARWQAITPDQVVSYKVHVRQRRGQTMPPKARVVCFHGRPRPWASLLWGRREAL